MNQIQQITADSLQQQTLILPDGSSLVFQLYFQPMQYAWNFLSLTWGSFSLNGLRIVNSPNLLRQWKNQINFGIACYSTSNREPSQQQDFSSGASSLYVLSQIEVQQYEQLLSGVEPWNAQTVYVEGFLVTYGGVIYSSNEAANVGNVPSSTSTDWTVYFS